MAASFFASADRLVGWLVAIGDKSGWTRASTLTTSAGVEAGTAGSPLVITAAAGAGDATAANQVLEIAALALLAPSTASGAAVTPVVTSSLATSKVIKASAGNLYGINCGATTVAGIFLVHNSTTAPAAGAVTPIKAYPVGIGQGLEVSYNPPIRFSTGISITFTSAATPFTQTDSATAFIEGDAV